VTSQVCEGLPRMVPEYGQSRRNSKEASRTITWGWRLAVQNLSDPRNQWLPHVRVADLWEKPLRAAEIERERSETLIHVSIITAPIVGCTYAWVKLVSEAQNLCRLSIIAGNSVQIAGLVAAYLLSLRRDPLIQP